MVGQNETQNEHVAVNNENELPLPLEQVFLLSETSYTKFNPGNSLPRLPFMQRRLQSERNMMADEPLSLGHIYERIIENAESHVLILDESFRVVSFNRGFYWMLLESFEIHLIRGADLFEQIKTKLPGIHEKWIKRCNAALRGIAMSEEQEFQLASQKFTWKIYFKGVKLGHQKYITVLCRNITSQKLFQQAIIKHEANLRTILNSLYVSIGFVNNDLVLVDFNNRMRTFFYNRYGIRLFRHEEFPSIFSEQQHSARDLYVKRIRDSMESLKESIYLDQDVVDGKTVVHEIRMIPVMHDGNVIGVTISIEDIAARRLNRRAQQQQVEELLRLNSELDQFVYSTSHDLRAPLLSIRGVVNLMQRDLPENAYLRHIESSIIKLDNYVTNIVNYSRNNRTDVIRDLINFDAIISSTADSLGYLDGARIVNLNVQLHQQSEFYSDANRVTMIFKNLMSNAFQFYDAWKKPYLLIDIQVGRKVARIRMEDNGIGMKNEIKEKAFNMFFRGTDRSNGAGLGLYVVNHAVQKLSGTIEIRTSLGVGTVIEISLPNLA